MPDPEKVTAVREALPATRAGIYLNAGTCGPIPAESQRAMDEQAEVHPGQRDKRDLLRRNTGEGKVY